MKRKVSAETRRELCNAIAVHYRAADRHSKKLVLDEFVKVTGYHRKHAIRLLRGKQEKVRVKMIGKKVYQAGIEEALVVLWEASDRICGKRLKVLLPTLIEAMERHGHLCLDDELRHLLLRAFTTKQFLCFSFWNVVMRQARLPHGAQYRHSHSNSAIALQALYDQKHALLRPVAFPPQSSA